jgi:hypothetical protein
MEESAIAANGTIDKAQAKKVFKSLFNHATETMKVDRVNFCAKCQ